MTQEAQELLKRALALPDNERAELAGNLLESLDSVLDEDADAIWQAEIAQRLDQIHGGKVKPIPWSQVSKKGRALLHEE